jgi:hypothetical protein
LLTGSWWGSSHLWVRKEAQAVGLTVFCGSWLLGLYLWSVLRLAVSNTISSHDAIGYRLWAGPHPHRFGFGLRNVIVHCTPTSIICYVSAVSYDGRCLWAVSSVSWAVWSGKSFVSSSQLSFQCQPGRFSAVAYASVPRVVFPWELDGSSWVFFSVDVTTRSEIKATAWVACGLCTWVT